MKSQGCVFRLQVGSCLDAVCARECSFRWPISLLESRSSVTVRGMISKAIANSRVLWCQTRKGHYVKSTSGGYWPKKGKRYDRDRYEV